MDDSGGFDMMTKRIKKADIAAEGALQSVRLWRVALGAALLVQLVVVYAPQGVGGPQIAGLDKVVHVLIFAAPALAALLARIRPARVLGILALHAPVSELIQHLVLSRREGDLADVMADLAGVALGGLAYLVWSRRKH